MAPAALPLLSSDVGLARYLDEIKRFARLSPQQEFMMAKRWYEYGDREAAHRLVTSHLHLVAGIAMGFRDYGLPMSEVLSEGNIGLMQAVKRFEPDCGFRLATYATWWARASIQEYILRSWSSVKMGTTDDRKRLFLNVQLARSCISALEQGDVGPDQAQQIASKVCVIEQDKGARPGWPVKDDNNQENRIVDFKTISNIYDLTSRIIMKQLRAAYNL